MPLLSRHAHVLLIDDSEDILVMMRDVLEEEGYRVSIAPATPEVTHIMELAPDVIVQDLLLAGTKETGWHTLTSMRLDPALAHVPLILCTGATHLVTEPTMAEHLDHLGVRVLLKPFNLDDLLAVVSEGLAVRDRRDQALVTWADGSDAASRSGSSTVAVSRDASC